MRKLLIAVIPLAIAAGLAREQLEAIAQKPAFAQILLPVRVGQLLAQPPDAKIEMPLARVRVPQVADTWHAARGGGRRHEGQDIFAPKGTPIYSATDGIVVRIGEAGIGGNAVSVLGAGGRVYYYAHLSRFGENVSVGDEVDKDTVLGYVGNTGNARNTPSHLHFGIYAQGGAIDPRPLLIERPAHIRELSASG